MSPAYAVIDFLPNAAVDIQFFIVQDGYIGISIDPGDLAGFIRLDDPQPNGTSRTVNVHLKLPEKMVKPGRNAAYLIARELSQGPGGMVAVAAIRVPIIVSVPYPGYYADMSFQAPNVNAGEPEDFKLSVVNLGTNELASVYGIVDVYDGSSKIKSISTDSQPLAPNARADLVARMSTTGIKPGTYKAVATLYYDGGNTITREASFNIGTLYVQINNYTTEVEQGKISRFDFEVESRWNNPIENVYGTILFEGTEVKTPSYTLNSWEKKVVSGYIDTANQAYGEHDIKLTVYYSDKTTVADGRVRLVPPNAQKEPGTEEPKAALDLKLTPTAILIIVIVILVLVDINWLVLRNRPAAGKSPAQPRKNKGK